MILHALYQYYQRKATDPTSNIAPFGWEWKEIPYVIVLTPTGTFAAIEETREGKRARQFLVPQSEKRTVGIKAYLLWDNIEYALGANPRGRDDIAQRHAAFLHRIEQEAIPLGSQGAQVLLRFLQSNPIEQIERSADTELWQRMLEENPFVVFRIQNSNHQTICDEIFGKWPPKSSQGPTSVCLVTGTKSVPARLHQSVKGVRGANANGAALVSFNDAAFWSYGKEQSYNSPVSEEAAFAYTTALNILLSKDSKNKVVLGESTTIVFWAEEHNRQAAFDLESNFAWYIADSQDDPDAGVAAIKALYEAIYTGKLAQSTENFYVLGLAPNAGRIAVRFFRYGPAALFAQHIYQHFEDLAIIRPPNYPEHPPLYRLLAATAVENKFDNVPPNLPPAVIESILDGKIYPDSLLQACMRRIRATQNVSYYHAAILKAWLNRYHRLYNNLQKEVCMALDTTNTTPAYVLGRLFAVLEKIQEEAQPGINATIRERYYGSASSTPAATFPRLLKLANHHLAKLSNPGRRVNFEKMLAEISAFLDAFPRVLPLHDQALFALGYYHQRQALFTKQSDDTTVPHS